MTTNEVALEQASKRRLELRARWNSPEAQGVLKCVLKALRERRPWTVRRGAVPHVEEVENCRDLRGAPLSGLDLPKADLTNSAMEFVDVRGANLSEADLRGSELNFADLSGADFSGANMEGTRLQRAVCLATNFSGAYMVSALLTGSDLGEANFTGANLRDALLFGANIDGAIFIGADMTNTRFGQFSSGA